MESPLLAEDGQPNNIARGFDPCAKLALLVPNYGDASLPRDQEDGGTALREVRGVDGRPLAQQTQWQGASKLRIQRYPPPTARWVFHA